VKPAARFAKIAISPRRATAWGRPPPETKSPREWIAKRRRDELRNVAAKRLDAQAKAAKAWLDRLPSIAELMPRLRLVELEADVDASNAGRLALGPP
jgi:hypothetical protein